MNKITLRPEPPGNPLALSPLFSRSTRWIGIIVVIAALLVLAGWQLHHSLLFTFIPGGVPMNPLTAMVLLALGLGVLIYNGLPGTRSILWLVSLLAFMVFSAALIRLIDYVVILPWHPDTWFFTSELKTVAFAPNRMAPETAFASVLAGLALGVLPLRASRVAQILAIGVFFTAIFSLHRYLLIIGWSQYRGIHIPMALLTALSYLLISIAICLFTDGVGLMRVLRSSLPGGILLRRILPAIVMVPMALGWLRGLLEFHYHVIKEQTSEALFITLLMVILVVASYFVALRMNRIAEARQSALDRAQASQRDATIAREQAEAAAAAKGQFLASMSHEIRTPLHGIISMLALLEESTLGKQQRHYTQIARTSANSLLGVVNDILDFSKIEAGRLELHPDDFDLRLSTEDTLYMLLSSAEHKGLELICQVAPDVPGPVTGDLPRLRQVLVNLLSNAIKFTDAGEVLVKVTQMESATNSADGMELIRFAVQDTGIGIAPEHCADLFTAFTQVTPPRGRLYGGTGLGLAISRRLVELMGGTIAVESSPGKGSCFWFTVKLRSRQGHWLNAESIPGALRRLRVVVAVPSASVREALLDQLTFWQLPVRCLDPGEDVVAAIRKMQNQGHPADMLILDYDQPQSDALGIIQRIHSAADMRIPGILLLTRGAVVLDEDMLRRNTLFTQIPKPVRQSQLFDALMQLMTGGEHKPAFIAPLPPGRLHVDASLRGLNILVAEDNDINQYVIKSVLEQLGLECRIARNGQDCLAMLERQPAALVLMDGLMPEMDGYEATREIRQRELSGRVFSSQGRGRIPIIALTANTAGNDRQNCLDAGMDDFLTKPLDRQMLIEKMRLLLSGSDEKHHRTDLSANHSTVSHGTREPMEIFDESPPMDIPRLLTYCDQSESMVEKFLERFAAQTTHHLTALDRALRDGDWETAARGAHSIKGTAASLFASSLHTAAAHVEKICREARDQPTALESLKKLDSELTKCIEFIHARSSC